MRYWLLAIGYRRLAIGHGLCAIVGMAISYELQAMCCWLSLSIGELDVIGISAGEGGCSFLSLETCATPRPSPIRAYSTTPRSQ